MLSVIKLSNRRTTINVVSHDGILVTAQSPKVPFPFLDSTLCDLGFELWTQACQQYPLYFTLVLVLINEKVAKKGCISSQKETSQKLCKAVN